MTSQFTFRYRQLCRTMLEVPVIHTGTWQSTDVSASPMHATHEMLDETYVTEIPDTMEQLQLDMPQVNLPWAELHFQERVSGSPLNPPPSHTQWPWARHNARFQDGVQGQFSHSYPERMWPKRAGTHWQKEPSERNFGIRFQYGDLADIVYLLVNQPLTRQAYLPIWFPEDTGVHHSQRVPCTLGYHFMIRDNRLSCRYYMRSCDLVRHFPDDVYLAARLTQWIAEEVTSRAYYVDRAEDGSPQDPSDFKAVMPGHLRMYITSLHAFVGDEYHLRRITGTSLKSSGQSS